MKKDLRIKKSQEFEKIIKKRKSFVNKEYVLYYLPNDSHLRVGISVSKKLGKAVVRNKVKRQVRMMVLDIFDEDIKNDYIIIVRNKYLRNDFNKNKKSLESLYLKSIKKVEKNGFR